MLFAAVITLMCLAAMIQRDKAKRRITCFYALMTLLHIFALGKTDGLLYYGSAALFNFIILLVITTDTKNRRLVIRLSAVCILEIFCNSIGWLMWFAYMPPIVYNWAYIIIYVVITGVFISESRNVRGDALTLWHYRAGIFDRKSLACNAEIHQKM